MSFFSGNTKAIPVPDQKPMGLDSARLSTNQAARPVPVMHGAYPIGITFLSQAFDRTVRAHKEDFGKEDRVVGYHYRASFAGLVGCPKRDRIDQIKFDGEVVWPPAGESGITRDTVVDKLVRIKVIAQGQNYPADTVISVGGASARPVIVDGKIVEVIVTDQGSSFDPDHPPAVAASGAGGSGASFTAVIGSETSVTLTVTYQGQPSTWRFYWGMDEGDYDPLLLELSDTGRNPLEDGVEGDNVPEEHPAYLGQCYFVAVQQYIGYNKTQVPNIEIISAAYPTHGEWLEAASAQTNDCNPVAAIVQDLTDRRYGLGISINRLDTVGLNTTALALAAEDIGISTCVTAVSGIREHLTRILEHIDGYHTVTDEGKFTVGLIREKVCAVEDPTTPYFDETDLVEPPELEPASWEDTINQVSVTFKNRLNGWADDAAPGTNLANFQITGEPRPETLQRPWFTRVDLADAYARAAAQALGMPRQGGRLVIRKSRLQGATVGGICKLSYGHLGICYQWCRITELRVPNPYRPEIQLTFELDRGYLTQRTYTPPTYTPPAPIVHPVEVFTHQRVIELPYIADLSNPTSPWLAALAAKPTRLTTQFAIVVVVGAAGTQVKTSQGFAYYGTLDAGIGLADVTAGVTLSGADTALEPFSGIGPAEDLWLLIIGDEIMAVTEAALGAGTDQYTLSVVRERYDTKREQHAEGVGFFLITRRAMTNCIFETGRDSSSGLQATMKLQPYVLGNGAALGDCSPQTVTFTDRSKRWWKPRNLTVNDTAWWNGPATYASGGGIDVTWTPVSRIGNKWEEDLQNLWYIELLDEWDSVVDEKTAAASASLVSWSNAELKAAFGGAEPATFTVRIYAEQLVDGAPVGTSHTDDSVTVILS